MRAVIQRVSKASVTVEKVVIGSISEGLLVLLGVSATDDRTDAEYVVEKTLNLRIFEDAEGKMNHSLLDIGGELLVVSQFTLFGDTRRGRRPSFIDAAPPARANTLYEHFLSLARLKVSHVATGKFQAMMDVESINAGPVTILVDSEKSF